MGMSINTNVGSLNAQTNLNSVSKSLGSTMERVSSGLRINSAKDDAAGMSIASKIGAQVSGMGQAARNVGSAMLLAKTAESDLGLMRDGLVRMRTLAVQAADGSYSPAERTKMNNEFVEIRKNIESIANTSNFNGKKLLDGSMQNQQFQVGANANETIAMSVGSVSTSKLGSSAAAAISTAQSPTVGTGATGTGLTGLKEGAFSLNGVSIGPSLAAADSSSKVAAAASSIAKAAAVNLKSAQTGVTATVNATEVAGGAMTAGTAAAAGTATINGVAITIQTTGDAASTRAAVVSAINAQEGLTGVTAVDSGTDKGGVSLVAKDGRNITLQLGTVTEANTGLQSANAINTYTGSITLNSEKAISITSNQTGALGTGGIKDAGLTIGTFQAQTAYASTLSVAPVASGATAFTAGDFTINGSTIGASLASTDTKSYSYQTNAVPPIASKSASGIAKAAAINELTAQTGVTATVNATKVEGAVATMAATTTAGTLQINGVSTAAINTSTVSNAANRKAVVDAINAISGQTGVIATDSNDDTKGVSLAAADGRNITAIQASGGTLTDLTTGLGFTMGAQVAATATAVELDARTYTSTLTLSSASSFTVGKGSTTAGTDSLGLKSGEYGAGRNGGALSLANLLTAEGATAAMTSLDNSLTTVEALRADMGTMQNRFQSSADSLANSISNQTGAQDQIMQSDFIADTAKLTSQEFLASVSGSTLAKANALQATMLQALIPR